MLLQVVPYSRDISIDLIAVGQPDPRHLAKRRVGLLGGGRLDLRADPAFLRRALQGRRGILIALFDPCGTDQLVYCRHSALAILRRVYTNAVNARNSPQSS